ncbi:MAG: Asp-tRNA(Asn)/Glu-tRNA(Gln) amidotransferase subunit GatA [Opitutales bacterium]|nr:Asp-tRNA(Asn)/Glu-tRNA(Gln) amidotransferase subunit GatA [Opitutales bacterium]
MKTALEYSKELAAGTLTSRQLVQACLDEIRAKDGEIHAFLSYDAEDALAQADASDARRAAGKALSPLDGVPVAIKDNIAVNGQPLTCASKMLEHFVSPYDATVIANLRKAGAVLLGRCNMDEFAMGSSTENSAFVKTANPWNKDCVPGGSSGGSAAAVAARMVPIALGSDTGGSIRQPASFCGVVGFKPTYGCVSRYGAVAFASSLEQVGPLGTTVADVAMLYDAIASEDVHDSTALPGAREKAFPQLENFKPCRIGLPKEFFGGDAKIDAAVRAVAEWYKSRGCELVEISLPSVDLAIPAYYIIATAEASSNLARFDGIRYTHRSADATDAVNIYSKSRGEAFGEEVKRRILLGTYVLSAGFYDAYYKRAQKIRALIRNEFEAAFKEVDLILTPTTPETAFPKGGKISDPLKMYLGDICTVPANLAGLPAISFPCGTNDEGMPMGVQILGKALKDADVLAAAHAYEQSHPFETPGI